MHLNILKAIYRNNMAKIILNGERLKTFPLRSGTRKWCPLSPHLFNIMLDVLAKPLKDIKSHQIGREEIK